MVPFLNPKNPCLFVSRAFSRKNANLCLLLNRHFPGSRFAGNLFECLLILGWILSIPWCSLSSVEVEEWKTSKQESIQIDDDEQNRRRRILSSQVLIDSCTNLHSRALGGFSLACFWCPRILVLGACQKFSDCSRLLKMLVNHLFL